jgi:hypothetical protein
MNNESCLILRKSSSIYLFQTDSLIYSLRFNEENLDQMNARYLLLLYFAKNIPALRSCGMEIDGSIYFSLYGLGKIAELSTKSGLYRRIINDEDMTKIEDKIYNEMSEKGLVKIKRIGDTIYVTIKEKGEDLSRKLL